MKRTTYHHRALGKQTKGDFYPRAWAAQPRRWPGGGELKKENADENLQSKIES